jgi:hypothetical protein
MAVTASCRERLNLHTLKRKIASQIKKFMDTGGAKSIKTRKFKDAVLAQIFDAYKESGAVYQKTADPEIQRTMLDLKRCCDLAIHHLSPLGVPAEKLWDELKAPFSSQPNVPNHGRPDGAGMRPGLEE